MRLKGRFAFGRVCEWCDDLPDLEPLEPENAWIRRMRLSRQHDPVDSDEDAAHAVR